MQAGPGQLHHLIEVEAGRERRRPEALEGLVEQPQPGVGAEHGHGVGELVECRLLHLQLVIELGPETQFRRDVGKDHHQAAARVGLAADLQRPLAR